MFDVPVCSHIILISIHTPSSPTSFHYRLLIFFTNLSRYSYLLCDNKKLNIMIVHNDSINLLNICYK